jgi:hypothetical protein
MDVWYSDCGQTAGAFQCRHVGAEKRPLADPFALAKTDGRPSVRLEAGFERRDASMSEAPVG